jgi:signal transduction histidine kinase
MEPIRPSAEAQLRKQVCALFSLSKSDTLVRHGFHATLSEILETSIEVFGIERASVWLENADHDRIDCVALVDRGECEESPTVLTSAQMPLYFEQLRRSFVVQSHLADETQLAEELDRVYLRKANVTSMLDAPIRVFGEQVGVVCHEHRGEPRSWSDDDQRFAASIANFVGLALESERRRTTEQQMQNRASRFELLFEESPISLREFDMTDVVSDLAALHCESDDDLRQTLLRDPQQTRAILRKARLLRANRAAREIFGGTGMPSFSAQTDQQVPEPPTQASIEQMVALSRGDRVSDYSVEVESPSGVVRTLEVHAAEIPPEPGRGRTLLYASMDLTDLAAARKALAEINEELERKVVQRTADLQAALGDLEAFAYTVSHDLRAPLRAILAGCHELEQGEFEELTPEVQREIKRIVDRAKRMSIMIDDVLRLSRVGRHRLSKTHANLGDIARKAVAVAHIGYQFPKAEIHIELGPSLLVDANLIEQALGNVLLNAARATAGIPKPLIRVEFETASEGVVIVVRDNGVGIDPGQVERLFDAFAAGNYGDSVGGSGIGLAIVKRIADAHGGTVSLAPGEPRGAVFRLFLPGSEPKNQPL